MRTLGLLLAVAACGKGKDAPPPPKDYVALLTAQHHVALVGPFAPIHLDRDLTIAEVRTLAPDLVQAANVMHALDWFEYKAEAYAGVSLRVERFGQVDSDPDTWLLGRMRAVFDASDLKSKLAAAWGAPRELGARSYWYDPAAKLRCVLWPSDGRDTPKGSTILDCDAYTPVADMIGADKTLFGFEDAQPLLGMTEAAVKARWGRRVFDGGAQIFLRPTELAERATTVRLGQFAGPAKVDGYRLMIYADSATIEPLLEAKFGKPRDDDELGKVYRDQPRVALRGSEVVVGTPSDD